MVDLNFVLMGVLGGIARALMIARGFRELKSYDATKAIVLGLIGGIVYYHMVTEWGAPDTAITFFFSYSFTDIVDRLAELIFVKVKGRAGSR